jgi:hypothetical protein
MMDPSKHMLLLQVLGYLFLLVAAIAASVSMNFQKLAANQTLFEDPRTKLRRRAQPWTRPVYLRPLFVVAILLSAAASTLDFLALAWLPASTVGVFGTLAIIINLAVTRIILFESPTPKEWLPIAYVIVGCVLAIATTPDESQHDKTVGQLIERTTSCVYIVLNWVVLILASLWLEARPIKGGFPFIAGALGAQNVCMGKYIAYACMTAEHGTLSVRVDNFVAALLLCVASVLVHIHWLNKGFASEDAYFCIIVYQTAWFIFTTLSGIVVYDNITQLNDFAKCLFALGVCVATTGVFKVVKIHTSRLTQNADSER